MEVVHFDGGDDLAKLPSVLVVMSGVFSLSSGAVFTPWLAVDVRDLVAGHICKSGYLWFSQSFGECSGPLVRVIVILKGQQESFLEGVLRRSLCLPWVRSWWMKCFCASTRLEHRTIRR